jgi:hypothetical protein
MHYSKSLTLFDHLISPGDEVALRCAAKMVLGPLRSLF